MKQLSLSLILLLLVACSGEKQDSPTKAEKQSIVMPETFQPERLAKIGPEACAECHAEIVDQWKGSHHAKANRPVEARLDAGAFHPKRAGEEPGYSYALIDNKGRFSLKVTEAGETKTYDLAGVIAYEPLRQYLASVHGGRYQTTSLAYDPAKDEWFDVFADGREPGEWGHWTGQGMNWNANCAYCHMTDFHKGFDLSRQDYKSTWLQQGIACAQCHTDLEQHVLDVRKPDYKAGQLNITPEQIMESCASCHSRRDQLTAEDFKPGEIYENHFALSLPDLPGMYYPDGQIRDEVFVYGSFMMSRMGHAGVTCMDCHEPHGNKTILPAANNSLCMRCHSTGLDEAPIIKPLEHSHHPEGSTGNQCVSCHMPHTTYMQRDPRRDHGFLLPDPLLTRELGIPNACSTCHSDETVDWAVEWSEKWYGEALAEKPQRARARALNAAYEGDPEAFEALLKLAEDEEIAAWKATYVGLLRNYYMEPGVTEYLRETLNDSSAMVRSKSISSLSYAQDVDLLFLDKLSDPIRQVRISAAGALYGRNQPIPDGEGKQDWLNYLNFNADRPQDAFILARQAIQAGDMSKARSIVAHAVSLDRSNPEVLRSGAVLMSMMGDIQSAERYLMWAIDESPESPEILYSLALLSAEKGDLQSAIVYLQEVVSIDPEAYRAWYNLALAYTKVDRWQEAAVAIEKARPALQGDPGWEQTRAIIQRRLSQP